MRRDERGFALLLVVLVVVVLSGTLLGRALHAKVEYRHAMNAGGEVRARAAARAGVAQVRARLEDAVRRSLERVEEPGLVELALHSEQTRGLERVVIGAEATYSVHLHDVASRLSVNHASEEELRRLFLAVGASYRLAELVAQSVVSWREVESPPRQGGIVSSVDHIAASEPGNTAERAFESLEEVRQVRGMDRLDASAIGYLTPFGDGRVNLNTAPEPVLRAVPGLGDESIQAILAHRRSGAILRNHLELERILNTRARSLLQENFAAFVHRSSFQSEVVEVVSTGTVEGVPLRRTARALLARSGPTVQMIRSFEE